MKTAILAFLFISLIFINNSSSQWVHLPAGTGAGVALASDVNNVYCGTWFMGISKSTDTGNSWTGLGPIYTVRGILIDGNNIFAATDHNGIHLTTNNGTTWTAMNNGLTDPSTGNIVRIGSYLFTGTHMVNSGTVYRSSNNGASWEIVNNGLSSHSIGGLASRGNYLFAPTFGSGIFLSTNLGESWIAVNNGLTDLYVGPIVFSSDKVLIGTISSGVFLSSDNGSTWIPRNNGLNDTNIDALTVSGNYIFAGVPGGVYMTSNAGQSWTAVNDGLTIGSGIYLYSFTTTNEYIFAGMSNGVWRRPLNEVTEVQNQNSGIPVAFSLYQNYPNPFNPSTKIKFDIPAKGNNVNVNLVVYDILGSEVAVLVNKELKPGNYEYEWNGSNYPTGVYFYKLTAGDFTEVRKMILIK